MTLGKTDRRIFDGISLTISRDENVSEDAARESPLFGNSPDIDSTSSDGFSITEKTRRYPFYRDDSVDGEHFYSTLIWIVRQSFSSEGIREAILLSAICQPRQKKRDDTIQDSVKYYNISLLATAVKLKKKTVKKFDLSIKNLRLIAFLTINSTTQNNLRMFWLYNSTCQKTVKIKKKISYVYIA